MDLQLNGKTALITGSTAGIGFATAKKLAQEGVAVYINGRAEVRTSEAAQRLKEAVPDATVHAVAADFLHVDEVNKLLEQLPEVDILINNVGIFEPRPFAEIPDAEWLRFYEMNVLSGVRLARRYLQAMLKKNWGRIVFISSESALNIPEEMIHYGMTKTAQLAVSRGLAELTRGTAVTVNAVLPGPTRSEGVGEFIKNLARQQGQSVETTEREFFKTARPGSLLQRFITPDEIANLIVYLSSPLAAANNGAAVRADGGLVKTI